MSQLNWPGKNAVGTIGRARVLEVVLYRGRRIEVRADFDSGTLKRLLSVLDIAELICTKALKIILFFPQNPLFVGRISTFSDNSRSPSRDSVCEMHGLACQRGYVMPEDADTDVMKPEVRKSTSKITLPLVYELVSNLHGLQIVRDLVSDAG